MLAGPPHNGRSVEFNLLLEMGLHDPRSFLNILKTAARLQKNRTPLTMTTANALTNVKGKWVGDGGEGEITHDGPSLTVKSATRGTPLNVCYDAPIPDGDFCFEVILVKITKDSSISVGVVSKDEFSPGWKTRGMFYNGNLTNGSAALQTSFGPYLKEGDTIGVYVSNGNRNVTFIHDGRCLGTGFSLPEGKPYHPCIHVSGEVQVSFAIPETLPTGVVKEGVKEGLVDEWKLIEAVNESGTPIDIPEARDVVLNLGFSPDGNQYELSLRVGNTLRCHATKEEGGSIKVGMIMSTMMESPPELKEIEAFLSSSLPNATSLDLVENKTLMFAGSDGSQLKLVFERYLKTFKPLEKYTN